MELTTFNFWGKTKYWWGIMLVGILLIPAGLWLLFQPVMGYAVISMLLGWGLILFGVVQLTVSGDIEKRGQGWGWWLAGGIFDIFIGFLLISNLALSETVNKVDSRKAIFSLLYFCLRDLAILFLHFL